MERAGFRRLSVFPIAAAGLRGEGRAAAAAGNACEGEGASRTRASPVASQGSSAMLAPRSERQACVGCDGARTYPRLFRFEIDMRNDGVLIWRFTGHLGSAGEGTSPFARPEGGAAHIECFTTRDPERIPPFFFSDPLDPKRISLPLSSRREPPSFLPPPALRAGRTLPLRTHSPNPLPWIRLPPGAGNTADPLDRPPATLYAGSIEPRERKVMDDGLQRAHDRLLEENGDMRREIEVLTRDVNFLLAQNRRLTAENRDLLEEIDDWIDVWEDEEWQL